jgi:dipeptidyl aminopeptidase/acylaminoacyl peptidase
VAALTASALTLSLIPMSSSLQAQDPGSAPVQKELPPLIPLEDFFKNPEKAGFRLSPNGEYVSYLAPWKGRLNIHVRKVDEPEDAAKRITSVEDRDLGGYFWESNDTIVYSKDTGGDEDYHLFAVNRAGGEARDLTPFPKVKARVVDDLEDRDGEMLISMNKRDPRIFDVFRLKVESGELTQVAENPGNVAGWMTDHDGKLRVAMTSDGVNSTLLYRDKEDEEFRPLITTDFRTSVDPEMFTFDNKRLIVNSNLNRDKSAIIEFDPQTKAETGPIIYENPEVDAGSVIYSKKKKILQAVVYETDKSHYHFLDKEREDLQKFLEAQFPGQEVYGRSRNREENRMIFGVASDRNPGTTYLLDIPTKAITKLAVPMPWIKPEQMAEMKPITYTARDGLVIHGYLTLPTGLEHKNLPVVVNPHGGPWSRDSWGFSGETQFLANRGYAVLQMNFRSSTGYGRKFWEAGFKKWGLEMQDDITDGVKWLVDQGIADPKRVAIYGASYGGYATLAGLTFTPDLYAAGVDYVGVSNIFTLMESMPAYWELFRQMMYEQVGDPVKDKELLEKVSPLFHVDKIKAPLMVAQGLNDPRVKKAESDQIVKALRARGIQVPYMVKDDEGHGFGNEENQFDFYRAMEAFLAKNLGGRSATPESVLEPLMTTPVEKAEQATPQPAAAEEGEKGKDS